MSILTKITKFISNTFAIWVVVFAVLAIYFPIYFKPLVAWIPYLLGIVMLGMGLTLTFKDFAEVIRNPKAVAIGVVGQFVIMPSLAFLLVKLFDLPADLAIGVILVGSCPGGTSSNVMTFLAKGNTALSIACTTISTLLAPLLTPVVFYLFASEWLDINMGAMFISVLKVVLLPIFIGLMLRSLFKQKITAFTQTLPIVSVIAIVLILSAVVAVSKDRILASAPIILAIIMLHNTLGYGLGFLLARLFRLSWNDSKAISIEVGMQNSGLGAALAAVHFKMNPIVAVPSAIFSFWHNLSGPILAMLYAAIGANKAKERQ